MMKEIAKNIYWVGKVDDRKVPFHRLILEKGTSYNAYLIKDEKNALIDTVDLLFGREFVENLAEVLPLDTLSYVVINHTEPDHSGALGALIRKAPNAQVVCTAKAVPELMAMYKIEASRFLVVTTGDELSLGETTLSFHETPFLHTEETMVTYHKETQVLFTCDIFSTHVAHEGVLKISELPDAETMLEDFKVYYKLIMDPHRRYILPMIDVVKNLPLAMIATSHGYVLDQDLEKYIGFYEASAHEGKNNVKALILFNSMSGNTKKMARILEGELTAQGIQVESVNTEKADKDEVLRKIQEADGVLFGSSTRYADLSGNLETILKELKDLEVEGKVAAAFGSYGWSGEAVEVIQDYLLAAGMKALRSSDVIKSTGMDHVSFPLRVKFNPEDSLPMIKAASAVFADAIRY